MRTFYLLKVAQGLCCFLILCFAISTTELRGLLFVYNGKIDVRDILMNPPGTGVGCYCEHFIIYKPTKMKPMDVPDGVSSLASDDDDESSKGGSSSGRIMAYFDGSKTNKDENSTNQLSLRGFVFFEWETSKYRPLPMPENATTNDDALPEAETPPLNATTSDDYKHLLDEADDYVFQGPQFPNGTQIYKLEKMEAVRSSSSGNVRDPFQYVASRLFAFSLIGFIKLAYILLHLCSRDKNMQYSLCELLCVVICVILSLVTFFLSVSVKWDSLWLCTNFRPEKPSVFLLTAICSAILIVLFMIEALYAEELVTFGKKKNQKKPISGLAFFRRERTKQTKEVFSDATATTLPTIDGANKKQLANKPASKEEKEVVGEIYMIRVQT